MKAYTYTISPLRLMGSELLAEASAEELRVLVCLMECGGRVTLAELAHGAGVREARAASAVSFWEAGGAVVMTHADAPQPKEAAAPADEPIESVEPIEEFAFRLRADTIEEEPATAVAGAIRDHDLYAMLSECATLLGKPTLGDREVRALTGLYTQYALSEEYIVTLLGDMCSRSRATVRTLVNRAIKLSADGIDTIEKLNEYIRRRDEIGEWERRMRRVLGIYSRALTAEEKQYFRKWVELYGFGEDILSLAYDKTVHNTSKYSAAYMDKILTDWYEHHCQTPAACEERYNVSRPTEGTARRTAAKNQAPKERYGNFDPEEAFKRALERSFQDTDTKK